MGVREEAGGDSEAHPTQQAVAGGHYYLDQPEILHQRGTTLVAASQNICFSFGLSAS